MSEEKNKAVQYTDEQKQAIETIDCNSVLLRQGLAQVARHAILDELLSLEILGHRKAGVQLCLNGILAQDTAAQTVNRGNLRTLQIGSFWRLAKAGRRSCFWRLRSLSSKEKA